MLIGINGWFLTKPYTGIGQYTRNLFGAMARFLAQHRPDDRLLFAVPRKLTEEEQGLLTDMTGAGNTEIVILKQRFPGNDSMKKTFWEQRQVPAFFKRRNVDVMHFPYPANPWIKGGKPVFVTVHDTIPWTLPEYRKSLTTRPYQDRCRNAVKNATHIFTVSQATKQDIVKVCGVKEENISVVPNALAKVFVRRFTRDECVTILRKHAIPPEQPFFLYTGGYDDRKNVLLMVETFLQKIAPHFEVNFVLAGGTPVNRPVYASFHEARQLGEKAALQGMKGRLIFTGFVPEADLPALYQQCRAFVNLSRKEGFNMPLLEAAVSGSALVTSDTLVHHEVAYECGIFLHPDDRAGLAETLKKLLNDEAYFQKVRAMMAGFQSPFTWEESAKKTFESYLL